MLMCSAFAMSAATSSIVFETGVKTYQHIVP